MVSSSREERAEERIRALLDADLSRLIGSLRLVADSPEDAEDALAEALGRGWDRLRRGRAGDREHLGCAVLPVELTIQYTPGEQPVEFNDLKPLTIEVPVRLP